MQEKTLKARQPAIYAFIGQNLIHIFFVAAVHRPVVKSWCKHIRIVSPALCWEEIRRRQIDKPECDTCLFKGQNLWLCLARGCSYIGCGLSAKHHSLVHGKVGSLIHCHLVKLVTY